MSAVVASPLLREDDHGIPPSLTLLAALVEAEARCCAAARPADSGLVCAFRGGAVPKVPVRIFLEWIHLQTRSVPATRGMVWIDGPTFILAGIYLTRFIRSAAEGRRVSWWSRPPWTAWWPLLSSSPPEKGARRRPRGSGLTASEGAPEAARSTASRRWYDLNISIAMEKRVIVN